MRINIETQIQIQAPASVVWDILTDFGAYPSWSPTIKEFSGEPRAGFRSKVLLTQPGGSRIRMNPLFLRISEPSELRWKGKLFVGGLFDGEHYFRLEPLSSGETLFIQGEHFSGLLVIFLQKMIHGNSKAGFELFNKALKARAESML